MKKTLMVFVFGVALLGAGCTSPKQAVQNAITEKVIEKSAGSQNVNVDVQGNGEVVTMTGADGQTFEVGKNRLPEGFPTEIPLYAGTTVASSTSNGKTGTEGGWTVTLASDDSVSAIGEYYKNALSTDGWETTYSYTIDQSIAYSASHDTLSVTVSIAPGTADLGNTMIVMLVAYDTSASSGDGE